MRHRRGLAAVLSVLAASLLLAGCGSSATSGQVSQAAPSPNGVESLTADQILAKATAAAKEQTSVAISGTSGGSGSDAVQLDLKVVKGGTSGGTITIGTDTVDLVTTSSTVYLKGDKTFWGKQGDGKAAELIGNRWLKAPASDATWGDLASFGDFDKILDQLLTPSGSITKGSTGDVDGTKAIALTSGKGSLWVATTGAPLPLRIDRTAGGSISLKDWGKAFDVKVPADSDVIDVSALKTAG